MNYVAFLILRRLRTPLIALITIYSILILGYVLIPGQDAEGNVYRMSFFHAFYFVSFMGSTIGFGELPYEFTTAQRFWTLIAIYSSVIAWIYSIGAVVAILRDETFLRLLQRGSFRIRISRQKDPFYIVCGYGLTGRSVVEKMINRGMHCVVVDNEPTRLEAMELDSLPFDVLALCANASDPDVLNDAGIEHPCCVGVVCLTNDDHVNLSIAITSKLLRPDRVVISRVATQDYAKNLASFGTDHILDPFEIFADYLESAIHQPYRHLIYDWLISPTHREVASAYTQKQGMWIICGYGRFGKALKKRFDTHDMPVTIVEPNLVLRQLAKADNVIEGVGTEADTLVEAGVNKAVGLIAGTADDANNLSIVMTARELNPSLVMVARQNHRLNSGVFGAAGIDMLMDPSNIVSNHITALLKTPLLIEFLDAAALEQEAWSQALIERMEGIVGDIELDSWSVEITQQGALAIYNELRVGHEVRIEHLMMHPFEQNRYLQCLPLLIKRDGKLMMTPDGQHALRIGDQILFGGLSRAKPWVYWLLDSETSLRYVVFGEQGGGYVWKKWFRQYLGR
ncbi:hypothetical protein A9Q99_03030 [Gammaproteobacteria bacterium 45_16_T64]|nr:hypothetical protein A9Q99_03030 [Gammaproteobacteria bacterium 45_16_T64]